MKEKTRHPSWLVLLVMLNGILILLNMSTGGNMRAYHPVVAPKGVLGLSSWVTLLSLVTGIVSVFTGIRFKFFVKNDNTRFGNFLIGTGAVLICFAVFTILLLSHYGISFGDK